MSELRLNILNGNWTVIAPERGAKPESFVVIIFWFSNTLNTTGYQEP